MSVENRVYFVAAGRSLAAIEKMWADRKAAHCARLDYAKSIGGEGYFRLNQSFVGVSFPVGSALPKGWKRSQEWSTDKYDVALPDRRVKVGKQAERELRFEARFHMPEPSNVFHGSRIIGNHLYWPNIEKIGDAWVIGIPRAGADGDESTGPQYVPEDAIPLKLSDYFRMKEEAEAAASAAP